MTDRKLWFPAKKYGWGWGWPTHWMGWVIIIGWAASIGALSFVFPPHQIGLLKYYGLVAVPTVLMIVICYIKGDKPRWRWGK